MDLFALLDINNTLVTIPIGDGYAMSWIEAFGTVFGLLCIWFASQEKNHQLLIRFAERYTFFCRHLFFQIQLYGLLLLQLFFFCANIYGWYAWTRPNAQGETLEVRWLSKQKADRDRFSKHCCDCDVNDLHRPILLCVSEHCRR
ncbi:nicotinamide riboside transporter PnuC [Vibrio sinaloensis]|nr:nicotinamide riboside transporter PnuC [Vibrio sinaloensis]